jgi:hypothetical protein
MPYLNENWTVDGEYLDKGIWIPERGWAHWKERDAHREFRRYWDQESASSENNLPTLSNLSNEAREGRLRVLGGDIGSVERDGLFYSNFVECLKNSPKDSVADEVVDRMQMLGFASAGWPPAVGGPPPHESPRPWGKVLDWLLGLLAKVGKFLLNVVTVATRTLHDFGLSSVSVGIGWPLTVSFEFPKETVQDDRWWTNARVMLDSIIGEMGSQAFGAVGY